MSTAPTVPPSAPGSDPRSRPVRNPLDRLRGWIRLYVGVEGTLLVVLYLAVWFWLGLLVDYGLFKAFTLDWVDELSWGVRAAGLAVLAGGLLAVFLAQLLFRLTKQFRDPALALVLERRYPGLLGDRLITAVELADPRLAERYGYSQPMIDRTVADAAERVRTLSVRDVFAWRRLLLVGLLTAALALIPLGLVVGIGCAVSPPAGDGTLASGLARQTAGFADVAQMWVERNVFLLDTRWPRRALLELPEFPATGELRVGRDSPRPTLRVRAVRWAVADTNERDGWRSLRWSDLSRPDLMGPGDEDSDDATGPVPPLDLLPGVWFLDQVRRSGLVDERKLDEFVAAHPPRGPRRGNPRVGGIGAWQSGLVGAGLLKPRQADTLLQSLTVDFVDLQLQADRDKPPAEQTLRPEDATRLDALLARLAARYDQPGMSRILRKLEIPRVAVLEYRGESLVERPELPVQSNNEYRFDFAGLKESVTFVVRGEDFVTRPQRLTLVPPPQIRRLSRAEERPAYLSGRPAVGEPLASLKGLKVPVADPADLLVTGESSRLDAIPAGSMLELTAEADKSLASVRLVPAVKTPAGAKPAADLPAAAGGGTDPAAAGQPAGQPGAKPGGGVIERTDVTRLSPTTFKVRFLIETPLDFYFEMTDTDGVVGRRRVIIEPRKDAPPEVRVKVEVLRRTASGDYLITPAALIPFSGEIRDDHGIERIDYEFEVARQPDPARKSVIRSFTSAVAGIRFLSGLPGADPAALGFVGLALLDRGDDRAEGAVPLITWARRRKATPGFLPEHQLDADAARELRETSPEFEAFDVQRQLPRLYSPEDRAKPVPTHYDLRLAVAAADDNADTGPTRRESERFAFRVIGENELLVEIGKEEETLHDKLRKAVDDLQELQGKDLEEVTQELAALPKDRFSITATRLKVIEDALAKGEETTGEVLRDYRRILAEMKANRVDKRMVEKVEDKICRPLGQITDAAQGGFEMTRDVLADMRGSLENGSIPDAKRAPLAKQRLATLIRDLQTVLENMGEITTINRVIASIVEIAKAEQAEYERLKRLEEKLELKLLESIEGGGEPPPKKK